MCGFDNDWACPEHQDENGKPRWCPAGGCSEQDGCAITKAEALSRLIGQPVEPADVHTD